MDPVVGQNKLYETYHGVYVNCTYTISVECVRGMLKNNLLADLEFIVECPDTGDNPPEPVPFDITPGTLLPLGVLMVIYDLSKKNNNVAIIGGGDGGVARACLENNSNFIDWFELDPEIVDVCYRHLPKICSKVKKSNKIKTFWGDAFKSIKEIEDSKYDKIFVDLNDDQYCIDLAKKNMRGLKRILKKGGVITAQVGSQDKKPKQVDKWCNVLEKNFGNVKLSGAYVPSFDCKWNFASSIMR